MEANTTAAPPKGQTIAQVLRALKPFLPEGYSKVTEARSSVGYAFGDKLWVEVYGVCQWNASTQEKEGCHAVSIRVTPGYAYRRTSRGPLAAGLRTATIKARKDGTFRLETVGARIQYCLAEIKAMDEARAKEEAQRKADAEATKELEAEVRAYLEREGYNPSLLQRYNEVPLFPRKSEGKDPEDEEMDDADWDRNMTVARGRIQNGPKRITFSLNGLTLDQLVRILRALKPVEVRTQPVRPRRRRSRS